MSPSGNKISRAVRVPDDIGALIKQRRHALGLNQAAVAEQAGVGRRFLIELEEGKPTAQLGKTLRVLAALGIGLVGIEE